MRKFLVPVLVLLLAGCASMRVSPDNPKLLQASKKAEKALNRAREVGADNNRPEEFQELKSRFDSISKKHKQRPTLKLVGKYRKFERNAYKMAVNTLQARFSRIDSRVTKLQKQLEKRVSSLEKTNSKLKNQVQDLTKQNNRLKKKRDSLRKDKQKLEKKVEELSRKNESLRGKMKGFRSRIAELNEQLNQSQSTIDRLQSELKTRKRKLTELQKQNKQIQAELNQKLQEGNVRTEDESVYVSLESRILFEVGDVHVQEDIRPTLNKIARTLKDYPKREVLVEGHTDDLPLQDELKEKYGSNWELSAQRAINVLKYLVYNRGVSRERIGAVAYGQFRPRVPNTSDENRRKNRRVEIVLRPTEVPQKTRDLVNAN